MVTEDKVKEDKPFDRVFISVMWYGLVAPMLVTIMTGLVLILTNGILFSVLSCIGVQNQCLELAIFLIANGTALPVIAKIIAAQIYAIPYEMYSSF